MRTTLFCVAASVVAFWIPMRANAAITVYTQTFGLANFNAAAANPPVSIDFDSITPNTDIGGSTIAGITFNASASGAPLIVVDGNATFTPIGFAGVIDPNTNKLFPTSGQNVLSPGGLTLGPGPDDPIENDDLELVFQPPLSAFGFDHLSQSGDGGSKLTSIQVFNQSDTLLFSGTIPAKNLGGGGAPGGADFWGAITTGGDLIGRIVMDESDGDDGFPDSNIGFDTFRFTPQVTAVPISSSVVIFTVGIMLYAATRTLRSARAERR